MKATVAGIDGKRARSSSLRVEVSKPKRRLERSETYVASGSAVQATLTAAIGTRPSGSEQKPLSLLDVFETIDMNLVEDHFSQFDNDSEGDNEDVEQRGCEPFLVANHVSQETLREYYEHSSYENSPFTLRFLELSDDGKLWIVDLPGEAHESAAEKFAEDFRDALLAARHFINALGSVTLRFNGRGMEADKTYGPMRNVPNNIPRPLGLQLGGGLPVLPWITFVVEVGVRQEWPSLQAKALLWYRYPGIQYILLVRASPRARHVVYELYDVNPLIPAPAVLPAPAVGPVDFWLRASGAPQLITLDNHRIMGVPQGQLPPGIANNVTVVDLRTVLDRVARALLRV
jgi:hypothetical protein